MNTTLFHEDTDPYLTAISPQPLIIPEPHPSFPPSAWIPTNAALVARQEWQDEWISRTYWACFGDEMHCAATASKEIFLLFLNQLRYPIFQYRESSFAPWVTRRRLISRLLREGYVAIFRVGEPLADNGTSAKDAVYYLVPAAVVSTLPPLTCADLHREKRCDAGLCCKECHEDIQLLSEISDFDVQKPFTGDNGPIGRLALVCCRQQVLLSTNWHYGKRYRPEELPEHEIP